MGKFCSTAILTSVKALCSWLAGFALAVSPLAAQSTETSIIPQIADGGAWQTTLVVANTTTTSATASFSFYQETSGGATEAWNLAFLETVSTQNFTLAPGATLFLHTLGTASSTAVGWAQLQAPAGVVCYAIFTERVPGRADQDGTAQAAASTTRVLVPFDNSSELVTSIALANPSNASESVLVSIQTQTGSITQQTPLTIPALGHMAFTFPQQFPATSGQRGLAEFYTANGALSAIALRFNPTGAFTTAPVYPESGSPIIGGNSSTPPKSASSIRN